jgi:hypothetical protein
MLNEDKAQEEHGKWNGGCCKNLAVMRDNFFQGILRSSTILVGSQIQLYLAKYFSMGGLLIVVVSLHVLLCVGPTNVRGFNASWELICNLMQTVVVQLCVAYVSKDLGNDMVLLNLLILLMVAEGLPAVNDWMGKDVTSLISTVSFIFSDKVSLVLSSAGVPVVGASLGLAFGGHGVFGVTMTLTGVNCICAAVFGAVGGGELSLAWPVLLLYFVHEVSDRFEQARSFVDYGLYKASDAVFTGLSKRNIAPQVMAFVFGFLGLALPGDPVWTGVCMLVLAQTSSDWFLDTIKGISNSDPVFAGLCIVTVVHFITLGAKVVYSQ